MRSNLHAVSPRGMAHSVSLKLGGAVWKREQLVAPAYGLSHHVIEESRQREAEVWEEWFAPQGVRTGEDTHCGG